MRTFWSSSSIFFSNRSKSASLGERGESQIQAGHAGNQFPVQFRFHFYFASVDHGQPLLLFAFDCPQSPV